MDKVKDIAKKWLTDNYGCLETYETNKHKDFIFYMKNGKVILAHHTKNHYTSIDHYEIWSFLESVFQLEYSEIQGITKEWVEQQYNLEVVTTAGVSSSQRIVVEQQYNLEVVTTSWRTPTHNPRVEQQYNLGVGTILQNSMW